MVLTVDSLIAILALSAGMFSLGYMIGQNSHKEKITASLATQRLFFFK